MENLLKEAMRNVVDFLESKNYRYAIVGGIANQVWGQARFTYDVDIKLLVPNFDYDAVRRDVLNAFPQLGRPELPRNPLIVSVKTGEIIVDFLLTIPGYEEQIVTRAMRYSIDDFAFWVCRADDLIIQKAIAKRAKDWQDIEGIVIEQGDNLDQQYIEYWLAEFAEALEQPDILSRYREIVKRNSFST